MSAETAAVFNHGVHDGARQVRAAQRQHRLLYASRSQASKGKGTIGFKARHRRKWAGRVWGSLEILLPAGRGQARVGRSAKAWCSLRRGTLRCSCPSPIA